MSIKVLGLTTTILLSTTLAGTAIGQDYGQNQTTTIIKNTVNRILGHQAEPTAQMSKVLDKLTAMGAQPLGTVGVEQARSQASPQSAAIAVREEDNIALPGAIKAVRSYDFSIPSIGGDIRARVYTPEGDGPFPLVIYYHGGGWVIANIETYDMSARAIAAKAGAVVISLDYRRGPEAKFPAAHEDAWTAYKWIVDNYKQFDVDIDKLAVVGESAGGNLAINMAIRARDENVVAPVHEVLVYPVAGNNLDTSSYQRNEDAQPLSKQAMEWFVSQAFNSQSDTSDPRINLVARTDLANLPSTTIINAEIDPLLDDGIELANKLREASVDVEQKTYNGVTHEFFGMVGVLPQADEATSLVGDVLKREFDPVQDSQKFNLDMDKPVPSEKPAHMDGQDSAAAPDGSPDSREDKPVMPQVPYVEREAQ